MQVIRSDVLGFCMGVSRAVEMARRASGRKGSVFTLGPLIHNPLVLEELKSRGVGILGDESLSKGRIPDNSTVIIRAHGIPPYAEAALRGRNLQVLDATCPRVKKNQKTARDFAEKGYWIFLAGEKNHGEIIGIRAYIESSRCSVVADPAEAEAAAAALSKAGGVDRAVLMAQTTISPEEYRAVGESIMRFFPALEILDTICGATEERQRSLRDLCGRVDAVITIGGRDSANTRRLYSVAAEMGKPAWIAESPEEIPAEIENYRTVGLCAGASTPESLIDEIEKALNRSGPLQSDTHTK